MSRARSCRWWGWIVVAGLSLICSSPLDAASFMLMPRDREDAMRAGRRGMTTEDWAREWLVDGGGGQRLTVMTPFHRLALAARNAGFQDRELRPKEIEALLREQQGKLVFWATLRGGREDFARFYTPRLVARQREVKASFTQNERTALRGEDGRYTARCLYVFPTEGLDPRDSVTLLVQDIEEKPVARFAVDLAAMR